jgi:dextranase
LDSEGHVLDEEFISVYEQRGDNPVMAFVTTFDAESTPSVLAWLRDLRCTVVQVYDWMESYSRPLADDGTYKDPLGRPIDRGALIALIEGIKQMGAVAQAYSPVCAADEAFAEGHQGWLLRRNDGTPESLGSLLQIMDPGSSGWQAHWISTYGAALDELGFDGLHLDTYGYPRNALDVNAKPVDVDAGYADFVRFVRSSRPNAVISFNQVNGVPRAFAAPERPGFRYSEVWPPNDQWRHLEGLLQRSAGVHPHQGDTLSIYPPVWEGQRDEALRTCVLSEAIVATLGASTLIWGDDHGVLRHPYYVDHEMLLASEIETVRAWHRFSLRCRDLFLSGVDTSWYELADENASVSVTWTGTCGPEPIGGSLYARVRRSQDSVVVSLIDLSGSHDGSWLSGTPRGDCDGANITVLVDMPEQWDVEAAVLGVDGGRFSTVTNSIVAHREGRAIACAVPIIDGWSIVRLKKRAL